jgi:hypothetical protein
MTILYRGEAPLLENSWYLKTGLFHHFICRCGQRDIRLDTISTIHHPNHHCSQCGNTHYLDTNAMLSTPTVKYWKRFSWHYERYRDKSGWHAAAVVTLPLFDYALQKIVLQKSVLVIASLYRSGIKDYRVFNSVVVAKFVYNGNEGKKKIRELIKGDIYEELCGILDDDPGPVIEWIESSDLDTLPTDKKLDAYAFFLKYDHLNSFDYFKWDDFQLVEEMSKRFPQVEALLSYICNHRKEKSVRRACFHSYRDAIKQRYSPKADYIFSRVIEDRNFLVELTGMKLPLKRRIFEGVAIGVIFDFFTFLGEHYSEKQIVRIFKDMEKNRRDPGLITDTLRMFNRERMRRLIRDHFRRPRPDIASLHDEFIRLSRLNRTYYGGKKLFDYDERDKKAEGLFEGFEFLLPETVAVLDRWSRILNNCMFGYAQGIHRHQSIIFGVLEDSRLLYAVEIKGDRIVQALGKNNRLISREDRGVIERWFRNVYLRGWIEGGG